MVWVKLCPAVELWVKVSLRVAWEQLKTMLDLNIQNINLQKVTALLKIICGKGHSEEAVNLNWLYP